MAPASDARIDFVDGALEPVLERGAPVVIEGFGFGAGPGVVRFPRIGGGEVEAPLAAPADWSQFAVRIRVPDGATSGALALVTERGRRLTHAVHVLAAPAFDAAGFTWQPRPPFPQAPVGIALAAGEFVSGGALHATVFAAGGAEPIGGDSVMAPDSGVYAAPAQPGGGLGPWMRQRDAADPVAHRGLPEPRAFAAAAVATRHNSRFDGAALYVIGGIDRDGRPQASVLAAEITADSVRGRFFPIEPLPAPAAGATAVLRRGRLYVIGGTDSTGRPRTDVFVGRIAPDGRIDGWYVQPSLPAPRAYGGGAVLEGRAFVVGGVADPVPPGGGLDPTPIRLVTADTAALSHTSGFFTGTWGDGGAVLPEGRSQFATLDVGSHVLLVGGVCDAFPAGCPAETLAAVVSADALAPFGPGGATTIAALGGGTPVGLAGAVWREGDGGRHGVVVGGMDLVSRQRRAGAWGF